MVLSTLITLKALDAAYDTSIFEKKTKKRGKDMLAQTRKLVRAKPGNLKSKELF